MKKKAGSGLFLGEGKGGLYAAEEVAEVGYACALDACKYSLHGGWLKCAVVDGFDDVFYCCTDKRLVLHGFLNGGKGVADGAVVFKADKVCNGFKGVAGVFSGEVHEYLSGFDEVFCPFLAFELGEGDVEVVGDNIL